MFPFVYYMIFYLVLAHLHYPLLHYPNSYLDYPCYVDYQHYPFMLHYLDYLHYPSYLDYQHCPSYGHYKLLTCITSNAFLTSFTLLICSISFVLVLFY